MFTEAFPILTARDLPRSLGFYRDLLGFAVTYRFPEDGEPVYVSMRLGGSTIGIGAQEDAGRDVPSGHPFEMCVYAQDCDAAVGLLRAAGVPVVEEPANQPWGERMARVEDPDGNRVMILSKL
jgi:lactoylglutathione lyase